MTTKGHGENGQGNAPRTGVGEDPLAELKAIGARANSGKPDDLAELREYLDQNPRLWQVVGDFGRVALNAWVDLVSGTHVHIREAVLRKAAALRADLLGDAPHPSPVEKLLIERIVISSIQLSFYETSMAKPGETSVRVAEFYDKRLTQAQRRHLQAVKALTDFRRLCPAPPRPKEPSESTGKTRKSSRTAVGGLRMSAESGAPG